MKKNIISCILFIVSLVGYSQDIIIKKTGDEVKAKVLEVNVNEIKYKRYDFQDGPTYTISKVDVLMIRYENGTNEVINTTTNTTNSSTTTTQTPPPAPVTQAPPTPAEVESQKIVYSMGSYSQNGRYISKTRVVSILRATKDAQILALLNKANGSRITGNILATALGVPLMVVGSVTTLVGVSMVLQDINPDAKGVATVGGAMAGGGIMLQFLNIGFQSKSKKLIAQALEIYNDKYADQVKSE